MKVLSIRQPWAWAIVNGYKDIENRPRNTRYRGPFLVHAGLNFDMKGLEFIRKMGIPVPDDFACGAIVGQAFLDDVVTEESGEKSPWFFGPYGYKLSGARPLKTYSIKGKLGFWNFPDSEIKKLI